MTPRTITTEVGGGRFRKSPKKSLSRCEEKVMKVFGTAENSVRLHPEEHPSPSASNRPPSLHHLHRIMAALHEVTLQSAPPLNSSRGLICGKWPCCGTYGPPSAFMTPSHCELLFPLLQMWFVFVQSGSEVLIFLLPFTGRPSGTPRPPAPAPPPGICIRRLAAAAQKYFCGKS